MTEDLSEDLSQKLRQLRDAGLAPPVLDSIKRRMRKLERPVNLMEVCGTHTVAISRAGLRQILPPGLRLLSGPGCPVCVTDQQDIDTVIELAKEPGMVLTTFGDMMRVPGSDSALQSEKAAGRDIRVVYSPLDALKVARDLPDRTVMFYAVGFETTVPMVAATLEMAEKQGLSNFWVFSVHKTIPAALEALIHMEGARIDGFILPGHVSTIIGANAYKPVLQGKVPAVVTGFEPLDILRAVDLLLAQLVEGRAEVEIEYTRAVTEEGNPTAQQLMAEFFEPSDPRWRGLGIIPGSGLMLRERHFRHDACRRYDLAAVRSRLPAPNKLMAACSCGEVLKGALLPGDCKLFGRACTPAQPVGPCMVSSEGACAAYYMYERHRQQGG